MGDHESVYDPDASPEDDEDEQYDDVDDGSPETQGEVDPFLKFNFVQFAPFSC